MLMRTVQVIYELLDNERDVASKSNRIKEKRISLPTLKTRTHLLQRHAHSSQGSVAIQHLIERNIHHLRTTSAAGVVPILITLASAGANHTVVSATLVLSVRALQHVR